ncbi:hypothetical protein JKF63_04612 [Porcisia hertigi]|uniref:C2 domain-containing protein n=1 Tax=Porcisia hertigi TaxID=2761500 RepID=A0A836ITM0_9TRYP|nr:hypothetical protein JKF63_04612 [Porcisia hertigi]
MHMPSSVPDAQQTVATAVPAEARPVDLATLSQPDEEDASQSSTECQTEPSSSSSLAVAAVSPPCLAGETKEARGSTHHPTLDAADVEDVHVLAAPVGGVDGGPAEPTRERLEEYWRPLAISPPLLPADLCQLQSDQPSLVTRLETTGEAALAAAACVEQPLPLLPCHLRWAQEPQPSSAAASESAPFEPSPNETLSSWAALGSAIKEYERVCRCTSTGGVSAETLSNFQSGTAVNNTTPRPLTVLWNTISSPLAEEHTGLQGARGVHLIAGPLQCCCGGGLSPPACVMETPTVCSVVVRCAAAILVAHGAADVPDCRYCPPTSVSVTGGCDGVLVERVATAGGDDTHGTPPVAHRAPVMQYDNLQFHAVLTRSTASSLLFTVHGVASPAKVFGFAVWTPFDTTSLAHVQSDSCRHSGDAGVGGGLTDMWLPLFAPARADAAPPAVASMQQQGASLPGTQPAVPSHLSMNQVHGTTGLLLVGWLHCDVEVMLLSSPAEAMAHQLWNGPKRSLSSLALAAAGEAERGRRGCMGRGIHMDDGSLVDLSVVRVVGLRPLATQFGMSLSPRPLRWDDPSTWGNDTTCACVYCEVVALRQGPQQGARHPAPRSVPHATGASAAPGSLGWGDSPGSAMHSGLGVMGFASGPNGQGRGVRRTPLSSSSREQGKERIAYGTRTGSSLTGTATNAVLPVTTPVLHTNHPSWQHTFRVGLASLSSLHLRVFDVCQHLSDGNSSGTDTTADKAGNGHMKAQRTRTPGRGATLLGTATVSHWLLRRLLNGPCGEGCTWLPLLWSPRTASKSVAALAAAPGKPHLRQRLSPAVCNGFVLIGWRRLPQTPAISRSLRTRESGSWYASVTRRLHHISACQPTGSAIPARSSLVMTPRRLQETSPCWYRPRIPPSTKADSVTAVASPYSCPQLQTGRDVAPWLQISHVRLQWVWLQHFLFMHGGQARLSLFSPTAQGETRLLTQYLLVPLCELAKPSVKGVCSGRSSRVHSRRRRDATGVYGTVLPAASLCGAFPSSNATALTEAVLCLPASPSVEVQLWWYPHDSVGIPASGGSNTPPRLIGRGEWRFPPDGADTGVQGLLAKTEKEAFGWVTSAQPTPMSEAGLVGPGDREEGKSTVGLAPLPIALSSSFFTPHEADLHVAPVYSTGLPQFMEGGVLTWRLMSLPRLACDNWGEGHSGSASPTPLESVARVTEPHGVLHHPSQSSSAARPSSTWVLPDIGTPTTVHIEVCNIINFDPTDGPCTNAAQATTAFQVAVSGTPCDGSSPEGASEASTAVNEVRCWLNPSETPPPDAPRLPCVFFPVSDSTLHGTDAGGNTGGVQQQMHQLPNFQTSWGRKAPLQQSQANASGLDCKGDAACSVMQGATVSRPLRAEIQWPPRRFGWVSDAPPSLSLWLMSPATFSRGTGTADITAGPATGANERVWGAVRLPRMDAFTKTSGVVWLPLFQSYAAPAPVAVVLGSAATTEDVIGKSSGGGDTAEQLGKTLPLTPSSTTGREESGVTAAHPPCAAVVVKHIGFAAIRYAHNMQRRSAVAATTGITTPSAVTPRVLLVRVGRLRQRFPACAAGRPAPSSSSFSSSPPVPFESHTPPSGAALSHCATAGIAVATAKNSTAFAAAVTDVLSTDTSGGTHVLLGLGAYQVSIKVPDTGNGRDGRSQTSVTGRVAVFPLPQRDAGAERSHELRVQARVGTSSQLATKTMCLNLDGDEETPGEAQWVPLVVRRLYHHNAHGAGYSDQGESVVSEILLQWRVVDFDTAAVAPRLGFSPVSLQRLVREYVGGATGTSCTYAVFSTQPAAAQLNRSPPRHTSAEVQRRAPCSESSERRPREQDTLTAEMVSLGLSRVLRMICPQRPHCVYLILDQLCLQCTARQRMVWTALQQETAALSQEVLADGRQDSAASAPIPLRLEVQLRWPAEWGAVWHRTALGSPRLLPKTAEPGVAPSLFPAAASSGAAAGADALSVWIDSGEGIFVERGTLTASADDESSAGVSGERLLSCASFTPLCLVLPSAQDIERVLGEQGLAARFSLTFALFAALQRRGDDASLLERVSDVCVGTGRTPVVFPRSAQFGLTSLLPRPRSRSSSSSSTCVGALANATDADAKGGAAPIPAFLSWRARVTESLPVPPKASSRFCVSPKAKSPEIGGDMSAAADGSRRRGHMSLRLFSSSTSSSAEDEAIKSDGGAEPTGYTAAPLMPRTPALARVTVTRIELCGVDVSLAHGAEQRHRRPLLPATVTVAAAPTHERGGAATATLPVHQLLPRLCPLHPTVPSISMPAAATPSLSMERVSPAPSPLPHVPLQQQRYMWSTDVSLLAPASQLIFCVSVPDAVLRSARVEEAWLPPRSPVSESEQNDTGALSVDAHWQSRHTSPVDVVGKAAWELDLGLRMETARPSGGDGERAAATQTADGTRDVVLEVESLGRGHWLGRLWARVDVTFADQLMRNAASVFFNSRMTLSVRNCRGFIVGDVRLTYRVEETYARLRERAALLCKQRGRVPRRLREQMQEIRHIRRQLRQEQGLRRNKVLTSPSASSTAGVVRLTLASGEDNVGALSTFASKPFALPTATDLVHPERGVARSSSSPHAPLLCVSRDVSIARRTEDVTATAQLELCQASSGVVVAAGQMTLPLYPTQASWREDARQSPASTVTSPLSIRVSLDPCTVAEARAPCIHPLTPSAGAVDVTATWSVSPARGDTWLTCIYVKRTAGCEGETKLHRRLLLRWVYCFEASAYPETEHAVDMPLSLKPSSIVSDHDGKGVRCRRGCRHMVSDAPVHWSGRAMQLPRIGAVGATIKRVELLEVTPISCAELVSRGEEAAAQQSLPRCSPSTQDACVITQLGKHVWSVADELSFERKRLQSQDSGEDALLWLTCEGAPAAGGQRTTLVYEVLLGLYTSSSLARRAAQLLEQLGLPATDVEKPLARSESAGLRQHLHPCAGAKALLACDPTRVDKAFDSSSPLSVANSRFQVSPRSASGGGGSDGGLVMRTLTFSCGHSPPLPTPELGQVQAVTCRVVAVRRQGGRDAAVKPHQHPKCECEKGAADCAKSSIVVLDAGMATSLLQERRAPEDLPHITTVSAPFSSTQLTAVWSPTAGSSHSTVAAPCAAAVSQRSDTHHRAPEGRSPKVGAGLLRVVLPLAQPQQVLAPTGDEGAGDVASDSRVEMTTRLEEKQFRIEVAVRGRPWGTSADETEVTARYVSVPFCASDILGSSQRHCGCGGVASDSERKVAVAGGGNPLCISSARWLSRLTMHLAPTPAAEEASNRATREGGGEGRRAGPVAPQLSPTAVMEVTWSLDTLSLLQTRACAAGVVWASVKCDHCSTHRNRGHCVAYPQVPGGSFARTTDVTDDGDADGDADDASSGEVEMRQMEAYSAWSEFLVAQKSVEETRMSQAGLQRWRCAIVGIEVTGLELPSWRCTGLDSEDDVYDAGQHASLLAQLVLPLGTQSTAVDGVDAGRELEQGSGTTGHHRRRRRRNKSGLVVGVARTTVTRIDRSERLNTDAVPTSGGDGFVRDGASGTRSVATATLSITSPRPRRHRYTATFNPLSWSMAVTDMIDQATAAAAAEHGEKKQTATAAIGEAPAAGLTVWHLLALPPGSSSSASNRIGDHQGASQTTMRMVYGLGATQLARLLGEGALYLVQILTRWCRDAYTTEERDALLRAAALYPTQWMPLTPATPTVVGAQCDAYVRFKYAYSYHGPVLSVPKSLATMPPPPISAPPGLDDAVFCAQLDRVQLTYTSTGDTEANALTAEPYRHTGTSAAAAWISRLTLVMRACVTTENDIDGTLVHSREVARWCTRLAPMPCGSAPPTIEATRESDTVAPAAPVASSANPLPVQLRTAPAPAPVAVPALTSIPIPLAVPMPATIPPSENEGTGDGDRQRVAAAAAPSLVAEVVPLLPTTRSFCWQSPMQPEAMRSCDVAQLSTAVPVANATETTTTTSVEMVLLLPDGEAEGDVMASVGNQERIAVDGDGAFAGTVVGRGRVRLGSSNSSGVVWDVVEGRAESGWRLGAPLSVRLPVITEAALSRMGCDASTCAIPQGEGGRDESSSYTLLLDLLVFRAPSMAQVAALQALRSARDERRRRSLSLLQCTEKTLVALATAGHHHYEEVMDRSKAACALTAVQPWATLSSLSQKWMPRTPYQLLRVPPIVLRVDTFAVFDGIPASPARCVPIPSASGKTENGPMWPSQTLWTIPQRRVMRQSSSHKVAEDAACPSQASSESRPADGTCDGVVSVEMQAWLVDERTGEVRAPVWTLLSNGPPALRGGGDSTRITPQPLSLASHPHAGRALLRDVQRLRLDWRSGGGGASQESVDTLSVLAGLVGCASVSYVAANGAACLWVSGGLRRCFGEDFLHSSHVVPRAQGTDVMCSSDRRTMRPSPPLLRSTAHHTSAGRRRFQPPPSTPASMVTTKAFSPSSPRHNSCADSCRFDYTLDGWRFLSCSATGQATTPVWRWEAHDSLTRSSCTASPNLRSAPRLFHSATLVGDRIWLLGGWSSQAGATTLPSLLARLAEHRRCKVYGVTAHDSDSNVSSGRLSAAALAGWSPQSPDTCALSGHGDIDNTPPSTFLRWCEGVQSVQCLDDGSPAPPVDVPLPFSPQRNCVDQAGAENRRLDTSPRIACHVAVACGDRWVAVFGGLMPPSETDDGAPVTTSAVHVYDTVQGTWSAQFDSNTGDGQEEWPMARYGHCVTPVPGTGCVQQPRSYFIFGGAATTPSCRSHPVPPEQLLWIWTPVPDAGRPGSVCAVQDVSVHSTWRRVQLPPGLPVPLTCRFLSQLHAYSAVEVATAICGTAEPLKDGTTQPCDPGLISMVLCVAGGMTASLAPAQPNAPAAASGAYRAFCECVEPWFAHPAPDVVSVLLTCVCEHQRSVAAGREV